MLYMYILFVVSCRPLYCAWHILNIMIYPNTLYMCSLKFFEVEIFAGQMTTKISIPQNIQYMSAAIVDFSQARLSIESKGGWLSGRDSSWAW